jgi:hypothetical protein
MVALLLLTLLQAPQPAPAQPAPAATTQAPKPRPRPAASAANLALTLFVTDNSGRSLEDVTVTLMGAVDREMKTPPGTGLRITGLRSGTYRARFTKDGFYTFEKEIVLRASDEISVTLNAAPPPPPPPTPPPAPAPAPAPSTAGKLPPPGTPKTMSLPDFIERNFISGREGHKENIVGCSGVGQGVLWQIREPWDGRQHASADGMLYVIGGEGGIKIDGREISVTAGSFAVVPRGTPYGFTRRGRNPLIVLAVLAGAPCAAE